MAKQPTKNPPAPRTAAYKVRFVHPDIWYFPTPDPDVVMACEWNAAEGQYNQKCYPVRKEEVPSHIAAAIKQSTLV